MWTDSFLGDGCETEVAPSLSLLPARAPVVAGRERRNRVRARVHSMGGRTRTENGGEDGEGAPPERPACSMIELESGYPLLLRRYAPVHSFTSTTDDGGSWKSDNGRTQTDG